jgi:hypothetical protein
MREVHLPPFAPAMLDSMRAIGYSFEAALADIVDNSIAAGARVVDIQFRTDPSAYLAIIDDGEGMAEAQLIEAMRHGGLGPHQTRSDRDLGRFGLGLKTASLSQCRRLTVLSKRDGMLSGARWDLDVVAARQDWILGVLTVEEARSMPHVVELDDRASGTIVIWEDFDRTTAGEADPGGALEAAVDLARQHLALAFHRFITGFDGGARLGLAINNLSLPVLDPFLSSNRSTRRLPPEIVEVEGSLVEFRPFILPHISRMTKEDLALAGGEEGLRRHQGFYVYRARRLITHGTWFRLLRQGELTKLARVQVDIPNSLDHLWALDVKKSTAYPPAEVRAGLLKTIERIGGESRTVYAFRGRRAQQRDVSHVWERVDLRDGFNYLINRQHPVVREVSVDHGEGSSNEVELLLRTIELTLPVDSIYVDMASDRVVQVTPGAGDIEPYLLSLGQRLMASMPDDEARAQLLSGGLLEVDVFAAHPDVTRRVVRSLRDDG